MSETKFIYVDIVPGETRFAAQITNYRQFVISKHTKLSTYDPFGNPEWRPVMERPEINGALFIQKDEREVKALFTLIEKLKTFIRAQALK